MTQAYDKIWDRYQADPALKSAFDASTPRYAFLARRLPRGSRVLNIGIGQGGLEEQLLAHGMHVHALDPSDAAVAALRERLQLGDRARAGYAQDIPFADDEFDAVVMTEVLEHLDDDILHRALAEVRRVLKPQVLFIGTVPANEVLDDNACLCPHCGTRFHRWGHVRRFDRDSLSALLSTAGYRLLRVQTRAFADWRRKGPANFARNVLRHLLGRAGARIASPNLYFEARPADAGTQRH